MRLIAYLIAVSGVFAQAPADNQALKEIFRQDQRDRGEDPFDKAAVKEVPWKDVVARDAQRLERVRALIRSGEVRTGQDQVYAAFILQHGKSPEDYALAHVLAATAATNPQPPRHARWLAAASLDRLLQNTGQPQIFGTQVRGRESSGGQREWTLEPYNRTALTDAERKAWCVIPLAAQEQMISRAAEGKPLGATNIFGCR